MIIWTKNSNKNNGLQASASFGLWLSPRPNSDQMRAILRSVRRETIASTRCYDMTESEVLLVISGINSNKIIIKSCVELREGSGRSAEPPQLNNINE